MVEKRTCDYTGEEIEPGTGIMYVRNDGSVLHFVDSKAEKNYKLGREPRDLEWTEEGRSGKGSAQPETTTEDSETTADDEAPFDDEFEEAEVVDEDDTESDDSDTDSDEESLEDDADAEDDEDDQ
ncbi:50S ribosomal protein L24e [Halostagnicola kamekurae]|uniref:Large ribosomal subunit protein eL24 n=1 Tax=Halostagnicola kamekurae TaxID=619731 RepID=A0A1I6QRI4_9EURY|nr:50S ribosomal protein L24e [Halostagnicola kamekurae]SFS54928.1 large subunit ribosomal protein L24e [Halostagnicola kamekurae]